MKYTSGVKLSASKNHTSLLRVSEGEMSSKIANSCTGENKDYFCGMEVIMISCHNWIRCILISILVKMNNPCVHITSLYS